MSKIILFGLLLGLGIFFFLYSLGVAEIPQTLLMVFCLLNARHCIFYMLIITLTFCVKKKWCIDYLFDANN